MAPRTQPPPTPPAPTGQQRPARDRLPAVKPRFATASVVRWGVLLGGLVIIVDLARLAIIQRTVSADDQALIGTIDDVANYVLFALLGIVVVRDTGIIYLGAVAGIFASLLDAIVVAAATTLAPPPGAAASVEEVFFTNLLIGTLFAGVSGAVYALVRNRSSGRRPR